MRVETRRRPTEGTPSLAQPARGPGAHVRTLVVQVRAVAAVAAHGVLAWAAAGGAVGGDTVEAMVAIVAGALGAVAEDVVGGGDGCEAGGRGGVGAVAVWVVGEGEGVELSVF